MAHDDPLATRGHDTHAIFSPISLLRCARCAVAVAIGVGFGVGVVVVGVVVSTAAARPSAPAVIFIFACVICALFFFCCALGSINHCKVRRSPPLPRAPPPAVAGRSLALSRALARSLAPSHDTTRVALILLWSSHPPLLLHCLRLATTRRPLILFINELFLC